jgi:kynurenine formamidase
LRTIIDLSVPISAGGSEPVPTRIKYHDHAWGAPRMALATALRPSRPSSVAAILRGFVTGRRVRGRDFPDRLGLAWETLRVETHHGTHIDAPWHYGPTTAGRPARTIEHLPLDWFIGPGVRLDLRDKPPGSTISAGDVERALVETEHELQAGDVALVWTGADELWGRPEYLERYVGLDAAATHWLLDHGVRVIGTDAWSLDRPPRPMGDDFLRTRDSSHLWPAHFVGREREYCQIEKLARLGELPAPTGYTVICLPVSIERASAGWTRAVAVVSDDGNGLG